MKIGLRIFLGYFLIVALAAWLLARVFVAEVKPGVRQAMEDTLVDTANVLAELATDDLLAGRIADGAFARRVQALRGRDPGAEIWGFDKRAASYRIYVTDAAGRVVFDSDDGRAVGQDYSRWNDVWLTLRGRYGARSTRSDPDDPDSTVMHVAAPIRAGDRIVGVLTVAKPNRALAPFIARSQAVVQRWGWVLMGTALLIGLGMAWWLARQLGALQRYAHAVTAGERVAPPRVAGEFGELGRALETMRARLEGKQYVEQYVHGLTHEMKGPLAAIRGSAELLEQADAAAPMPAADRARFAASIRDQSERLAQMIDKLLALAAVEYRQRLEQTQLLDPAVLADEVAAQCALRLQRAGATLQLRLAPGLPQLRGDAFLLRQALGNLVDNAADFSPPGGVVELQADAAGGRLRFEVRDRGPGVPDYARARVFERFYSLPRPGGGSRSSGLGLCFVAEVAALHGGTAALREREGGGTCASLELPAA
ncbi:two-component system sensor histidine kinase CreC [Cognatiluteimonas weifangensis]|uniref:histidine kinase n=1 Tax=Cognatiluteimonas weifangensis TaxID=2303539 RepID=A0A372DKA3_9GAMM|nr:two-component system sensor histidine kinase CreC [Luteimonas weifangensis]RFP59924.1 two-component system sensor histidine kinase CreC [Luteimonas weifangensis]